MLKLALEIIAIYVTITQRLENPLRLIDQYVIEVVSVQLKVDSLFFELSHGSLSMT